MVYIEYYSNHLFQIALISCAILAGVVSLNKKSLDYGLIAVGLFLIGVKEYLSFFHGIQTSYDSTGAVISTSGPILNLFQEGVLVGTGSICLLFGFIRHVKRVMINPPNQKLLSTAEQRRDKL